MEDKPSLSVVHVDGVEVHFREETRDRRVIRSTLERQEFALIRDLIPELRFGFIVDAGGYIGTAAIALSRMFPLARIITIEPSLANFSVLERNIAPFDNIVAINAALVGVGREVRLYDRRTGAWGFTILQKPHDKEDVAEIQRVHGVTLSDILAQFDSDGIDVLKVDIEGGELEVFEHSDQWIHRVGVIVAELHDRIQPGCSAVFASKTAPMRAVHCRGEKVVCVNDAIVSAPQAFGKETGHNVAEIARLRTQVATLEHKVKKLKKRARSYHLDGLYYLHGYGENGEFDYDKYRVAQTSANKRKIGKVWAREGDIAYLSQYLKSALEVIDFGICHGTRRGSEQQWFRDNLGEDVNVIGTEISDTADAFPHTIEWDFHQVKPEWLNAADFIYSNAFDHSYDPEKCIRAWASCLKPNGICIIEHSALHGKKAANESDPFGADLVVMPYLICLWGRGEFAVQDILSSPLDDEKRKTKFLIIRRSPGSV